MIPYSLHSIGKEEIRAVNEVLRSGWLTGGPKVSEFEANFAEYVGARYAVAINSGAGALYLAVKALFPVPRVRIAIPTLTYVATANAVVLAGHIPVFTDIDPETFCIDPAKIPNDVDGVIPVHYGGHSCDLHEIQDIGEIKKTGGWIIIEDAAHAAGAEYKGKKIGSINTTCFSFHPCKNMTTAEGGMITTNSQELADKLRRMRLNGIQKEGLRQDMIDWGFKFNMNEISAVIGIEQLKKLDRMNDKRAHIGIKYDEAFGGNEKIKLQTSKFGGESGHLYPILVENRDELANHLQSKGIGCAIHYKPVHLMTWYKERFDYKEGDFPVAEDIAKHILSIPIYPDMTDEQVDYVIQTIKEAV